MITKRCTKHPKYEGKREPKDCAVCWAIYNKAHNIAGRPPQEALKLLRWCTFCGKRWMGTPGGYMSHLKRCPKRQAVLRRLDRQMKRRSA